MKPVGLKWALGLSVVVNLFLIGLGIASFCVIHNHIKEFRRSMPMQAMWHDATKDMTPQTRDRMHAIIRTAALSGEDDMNKAQALRLQAASLAGTDPYDAAKISALSQQAWGYENDSRAKVEQALITGMATLPASERRSLAMYLLRPSFRFHRFVNDPKAGGATVTGSAAAATSSSASK